MGVSLCGRKREKQEKKWKEGRCGGHQGHQTKRKQKPVKRTRVEGLKENRLPWGSRMMVEGERARKKKKVQEIRGVPIVEQTQNFPQRRGSSNSPRGETLWLPRVSGGRGWEPRKGARESVCQEEVSRRQKIELPMQEN